MRRIVIALAGCSFISISAPSWAQAGQEAIKPAEPSASGGTDMEIVVTATKRSERLQDVPFAISAVSADTLTQQGEVKLVDISARVPGLQISEQSVTSKQTLIVIRGLSGSGNGNPTAALYLDDAPLNASTYFGNGVGVPDLDPSDLERIEVLKGPQGTLYGATSIGGLVKYITRTPDLSEFTGRVEASTVNINEGEWGYGLRGRVNAPLSGNAALTASAFVRRDPGYVDDASRRRSNINTGNQYGGRIALRVDPADNVRLNIGAIHQRQKTDGPAIVYLGLGTGRPVGGDLNLDIIPGGGKSDSEATILTGTAKIDFDRLSFTSASSYISRRFQFGTDLTDFFGPALPSGTGALFRQQTTNEKFTQEFRVSSASETAFFGWQLGAFYTNEKSRQVQNVDVVLPTTGATIPNPPVLRFIDLPSEYEEIAGSGTVTLRFSEQFDLEGGIRYSHNKQSSVETQKVGSTTLVTPANSSEGKTTFSASARYRPSSALTLYARIASGYRPGGPNTGQTGVNASYGSDSVISYEVGAKGQALERLLTFDVSAFYVDWSDIQLLGSDPGTALQYFSNAGRARSKGIEAAFVLTPTDGFDIDANVAYTDAYLIDAFTTRPGTYATANSPLPYSPKWSYRLGAQYAVDISDSWKARASAAYRYVGKRASFYEASAARPRFVFDSFETIDFTLGVQSERIEINLFLRNALDERALVSAGRPYRTVRPAAFNQPRTLGISLVGHF